ncbi:MAG: WG repeat-containing protein [Candidatus Fibromonas sp.]|jgi:uncharacterized protein (TIGR02145 family)|nr:WG repeat-containing protein [Candidatus Fibromonas sp.]
MKKVKLTFIAAAAIFCFACGNKTEANFSIVPIKGSNEEYQYIDISKNGKIVINPQFKQALMFRDELALVQTSGEEGKWGYIDERGKFIIAPVYSKAQNFSEGVAWVQLENQPPMLIDKKGKTLLQIDSLTAAYPFNGGIAGINVYSQGQHGLTMFIDKKGELVAATAAEEKSVPFMKDGLYRFQDKKTEKFGYRNKSGEIVINAQFDDISFFNDGMATILSGTKWGAIDKEGSFVVNPQYESLVYDCDGLFLAKVGKKWGWVNKKGEIIINPQFDNATGFSGSKLAAVRMGEKWAYIDRKGQIIINPQFLLAFPFSGDYAMAVNTEDKTGFINKTGNFIVPPLYETTRKDINEYLSATMQNAIGFSLNYQDEDMYEYMYERLIEKIDEGRLRAIAAASGSFTDSRDNKAYKTIKIGTQTWMAQNLNYVDDGYLGLCYGDRPREQIRNPENCDKYGRLYDWSEAMGLDREYNWKKFDGNDEKVQGVCPGGWHLPSYKEWNELMTAAGGENVAGIKLRAKNGWSNDGNGTDDYGFAALPGGQGYSSGRFNSIGSFGYWWSATESSASRAYTTNMDLNRGRLRWDNDDKSGLAYVRCVKE